MIRPRVPDLFVALALALTLAGVSVAAAQPNLAADQAFDRGRALLRAGDRAGACAAFREAEALRPSAGVELNLAPCLEADGQLVASAAMLEQARGRAEADGQTARVELATRELTRLRGLIPTIALGGDGVVALTIDEVVIADPAAPVAVDPGVRRVRARWADGATLERALTIAASERIVLDPPSVAPVTGPVVEGPPPRPRARSRVLPIAVTGAGVALAALGTGALVLAYGHDADARDACPVPTACPDAARRDRADRSNELAVRDARIGAVALAGAGVTLAAATWLWLRRTDSDRPRPAVAVAGNHLAVTISGSF